MKATRGAVSMLVVAFAIGVAWAEDETAPSVPKPTVETPPTETRPKSDEPLEVTIGQRLADDSRVHSMKMKVAVREGHVTLTGEAKDSKEKEAAEEIIRSVHGVRDVDNKLVVEDHGEPAPGASMIPEHPAPPPPPR